MYVLFSMFVTCPTSHAERLPLKAPALKNTAPHTTHATKKSPMIKMFKKKRAMIHVKMDVN